MQKKQTSAQATEATMAMARDTRVSDSCASDEDEDDKTVTAAFTANDDADGNAVSSANLCSS